MVLGLIAIEDKVQEHNLSDADKVDVVPDELQHCLHDEGVRGHFEVRQHFDSLYSFAHFKSARVLFKVLTSSLQIC
jgi:hypothetical protein